MKFHKVEMVGKLLLQKLTNLPTFNSEDESRLVYNTTNKDIYYANDIRYKKLSGKMNEFTTPATSGDVLEVGYSYPVNTSTEEVVLLLPSNPSTEDMIELFDSEGSFSDNNLIIDGNGNTVNGFNSVSFSIDYTFIRIIFDGEEWKVDIGGLNTVEAATGINFGAMSDTTEIEPGDSLTYEDAEDGETKKISSDNFLKSIDINNLSELSSLSNNDYLVVHDISDGENKKLLSNAIISGLKNIYPYEMNLDSDNEHSSFGSIFNSIQTVDFDIYGKGSAWFSFNFPSGWVTSKDINIITSFSVSSNDPDKTANLQISYWCVEDGDAPDNTDPDVTYSNTIDIKSEKIDKYNREEITSIESEYITDSSSLILIKVTRDPSLDDYSGKFKIANFIFYQ